MLGDVIHRGGHLIDRRRRLIGFALLPKHAVANLAHARGQSRRAAVQLPGGAGHGIDYPLITGLHGIECGGHLSHFVLAGQGYAGGQIAGFLHMQHHVLQRVELAQQEADQQLRRTQHGKHQYEHCCGVLAETLAEHLAQACTLGQDGELLTVAASDHFCTQ